MDNGSSSSSSVDTGGKIRKAATGNGKIDILRALLEHKGDPNSKSPEGGKMPLHLAAWRGSIDTAALLLDSRADLDAWSTGKGNMGKTAIFYAITRCRDDMVLFLLSRGASTCFVNNKGQTPYSTVCPLCVTLQNKIPLTRTPAPCLSVTRCAPARTCAHLPS